jgi:hypothetical protein
MSMKRYALVTTTSSCETVERYLPGNYRLIHSEESPAGQTMVIAGRDSHGWTLDEYVLPRLASGLIFGTEIDLSHEVMKRIPDTPRFRHGQFVTDPQNGAIGTVTSLDNEETEVEFTDWNGNLHKEVCWTSDLRPSTDDEIHYWHEYRRQGLGQEIAEARRLGRDPQRQLIALANLNETDPQPPEE